MCSTAKRIHHAWFVRSIVRSRRQCASLARDRSDIDPSIRVVVFQRRTTKRTDETRVAASFHFTFFTSDLLGVEERTGHHICTTMTTKNDERVPILLSSTSTTSTSTSSRIDEGETPLVVVSRGSRTRTRANVAATLVVGACAALATVGARVAMGIERRSSDGGLASAAAASGASLGGGRRGAARGGFSSRAAAKRAADFDDDDDDDSYEKPGKVTVEKAAAALGQRRWTRAEQDTDDLNNALDHGVVSMDQLRSFEETPWKWESLISCEGTEMHGWDTNIELEPDRKEIIRKSGFSPAFWRLPRSRHFQIYDTQNIRSAYCKAGMLQLNIATVMDSAESCEFARAHYDMGHREFPRVAQQHLGAGTFVCTPLPISRFGIQLHTACGSRATVEIARMENLWYANDFAQRNDGVSFEYQFYVDPEDFTPNIFKTRVFDPELAEKYQDKLRVQCYPDGDSPRIDNCDDRAMTVPRRVVRSRVFGGRSDAVTLFNYHAGYYLRKYVPLASTLDDWSLRRDKSLGRKKNNGQLHPQHGCLCPSDEEVMTQMMHIPQWRIMFATIAEGEDMPANHTYPTCGWVTLSEGQKLVD